MKQRIKRNIALVLIFAVCLSTSAFAATPGLLRASSYLSSYGAYCYAAGNGDITVYFDVTGNGTQNYLGTYSIIMRESADGGSTWATVATFSYVNYPNMMAQNVPFMNGYVTYWQGTPGYHYYAIIYFWGGSSLSVGDSRTYVTGTITAT